MHTERKLQDLIPEGTENVVVISCGLGIQTVADLAGKPVLLQATPLTTEVIMAWHLPRRAVTHVRSVI